MKIHLQRSDVSREIYTMKIKLKEEPNGSSPILKGLNKRTLHTKQHSLRVPLNRLKEDQEHLGSYNHHLVHSPHIQPWSCCLRTSAVDMTQWRVYVYVVKRKGIRIVQTHSSANMKAIVCQSDGLSVWLGLSLLTGTWTQKYVCSISRVMV